MGEVVIEAIDRGIQASGCSAKIRILESFGEAMLDVAQFDDQSLGGSPEATLVIDPVCRWCRDRWDHDGKSPMV